MATWMEESWSVETWLKGSGMDHYATAFLDNGYDTESLCANLKDEDLNAIGVYKRDHRDLFFRLSQRLQDEKKGSRASGGMPVSPSIKSPTTVDSTYTEVWNSQPQRRRKKEKSGEGAKHERKSRPGSDRGKLNGTVAGRGEKDDDDGTRKKVHASDSGSKKKRSHKSAQPPLEPLPATPSPTAGGHLRHGASTRQRSPGPPSSSSSSSQAPTPISSGPHEHDEKPYLTKLQLKLKIRDELQRMRVILTEPPYTMVRSGGI